MENGDLTDRLRRIGRSPVDPDLASRHIGLLATTQPGGGGRSFARVAVVAMAAVLLLVAPAAALVAATQDDEPEPVVPVESPEEGDEAEDAELSCTGPPPWAGEPATPADPENGQVPSDRAAEAEAFEAWRDANCPDEEVADETTTTTVVEEPGEGDECHDRPSWAGEPATPADPSTGQIPSERANEARDRAEAQRECRGVGPDDESEADDDGPGGPPAGVPGGPPTDVPNGPPDDVPAGPPDDVPVGPPAGAGDQGGRGDGGGQGD